MPVHVILGLRLSSRCLRRLPGRLTQTEAIEILVGEKRSNGTMGYQPRKSISTPWRIIEDGIDPIPLLQFEARIREHLNRVPVGEPPKVCAIEDAIWVAGPAPADRKVPEGDPESHVRKADNALAIRIKHRSDILKHQVRANQVLKHVSTSH